MKFSLLAASEVVIGNVIMILMRFSSLAAPEVVILTTSGAASDENLIKIMTFPIQRFVMIALHYYCISLLWGSINSLAPG